MRVAEHGEQPAAHVGQLQDRYGEAGCRRSRPVEARRLLGSYSPPGVAGPEACYVRPKAQGILEIHEMLTLPLS